MPTEIIVSKSNLSDVVIVVSCTKSLSFLRMAKNRVINCISFRVTMSTIPSSVHDASTLLSNSDSGGNGWEEVVSIAVSDF